MTQEDLAARANRSVVYIRRIEAGKGNPTTRVLMSIAEALSADFSELTAPPGSDDVGRFDVVMTGDALDRLARKVGRVKREVAEVEQTIARLRRRRT